ncbi:hypothetical protein KIW84_060051 [Lathyrus oleraceus]|uniref:DUF4283 domain-containing protein n=1 Tax=Pisum sativum TaxID=3888 RepID=A0A9D4W0A1_PEA|nr:hypothetical protein KIW84_060051 [Pisum sativum]
MSDVKDGFASANPATKAIDDDSMIPFTRERLGENVPRSKKTTIVELFLELRRKVQGIRIEECISNEYECPEILLSPKEENRIAQPWKNGVIVKMLGRHIRQEFFLVTFTCEEDQEFALLEGPWMIYGHYLIVREWSPNFYPGGDAIEELMDLHPEVKMKLVTEGIDLGASMAEDGAKEKEIEIHSLKTNIEAINQSEEVLLVEILDDSQADEVDEASALVLGLKLQNESNVMEKGDPKNDDGARRNKRKNLDQLGPNTLRAQVMDGVFESRAKDNEIEVEFFEDTPKELQGATLLHHNQIKVMFWNCRGAGNKDFISVCKQYIRENYPSVFMIMETRMDPSLLSKMFSFLGFEVYLFVENQGAWEIAMGWNSDILRLTLLQKPFLFFHVNIKSGDEASWNFTVIYDSSRPEWKKVFWQELMKLAAKADTEASQESDTIKDVNGTWLIDAIEIATNFRENFHQLYTSNNDVYDSLMTSHSFPSLLKDSKPRLVVGLGVEEINQATSDMATWKSSGPDGFPASFFQNSWDIIGDVVCQFIMQL